MASCGARPVPARLGRRAGDETREAGGTHPPASACMAGTRGRGRHRVSAGAASGRRGPHGFERVLGGTGGARGGRHRHPARVVLHPVQHRGGNRRPAPPRRAHLVADGAHLERPRRRRYLAERFPHRLARSYTHPHVGGDPGDAPARRHGRLGTRVQPGSPAPGPRQHRVDLGKAAMVQRESGFQVSLHPLVHTNAEADQAGGGISTAAPAATAATMPAAGYA